MTSSPVTPSAVDDAPDWPAAFVRRYLDAGHWQDQSFAEALATSAARHPRRIALCDDDQRLSYADLLQRCRRLAAGLRQAGLAHGDTVVLHLPNGIAFVETCFALFQLGVRPVLALPAHRQHEISGFCRFAEAKAYIGAERIDGFDPRPMARELLASGACRMALIHGEAEAPLQALAPLYQADALEDCAARAEDIACFQLSGGTTGTPKLIPRRHREYLYNVRASAEVCGFDEHTVYLTGLPMAHNFTLCCPGVIGTLLAGGRVVVSQRADPEHCFALIARERVTHTALVPPLAMLWLDAQESRRADLSSLRLLQVGGSRLGSSAAQRVEPVLGCQLQQVLGMAEGLICYTRLDDPPERVLHTQGRPLSPDDEVRVVDAEGREVGPGEVGELTVRGPYTIRGYYRLPEHNAKAFSADGFYRTGDRVSRDKDGRRGRGGEPADSPSAGARRHRRGDARQPARRAHLRLRHPAPAGALGAEAEAIPARLRAGRVQGAGPHRAGPGLPPDRHRQDQQEGPARAPAPRAGGPRMSAAWVRPFRLTPMPRLRLACFPHAGGSASFFRSWSERLPPDIDLLALQYPGREDRFNEAPATRLEDLADGAALALRDFADAPLALFGHSLGAALAYETALRLESAGAPLRHLFVSAHPAPHRQRGGALHRGDEAALLEDVRRQGGASELLEDADLRALFLPILRADYQAIETYRRAQPIALACALDVLLGEHDEEVSAAEAQAWSDASRTPARLRRFPGGHFYLSEGRDAVIEHLLRRLAHPDALSREVA